jgi:hypothetical protein
MKQKYQLKEIGRVVVTMILTDDEKEIEAEATFDNFENALKLLRDNKKVESVELDPEQTEESDTVFHFSENIIATEGGKKKEGIRVVNPIIKTDGKDSKN